MQKTLATRLLASLILLASSVIMAESCLANDTIYPPTTNWDSSDQDTAIVNCKFTISISNGTYCSADDDTCINEVSYFYLQISKEQCRIKGGEVVPF